MGWGVGHRGQMRAGGVFGQDEGIGWGHGVR